MSNRVSKIQLAPDMHTTIIGPINTVELGAFAKRARAYANAVDNKELSQRYTDFYVSAEALRDALNEA